MLDRRTVLTGLGALITDLNAQGAEDRTSSIDPLDPSRWNITHSPGMPPHPNAPWYFDFPHRDGIHYVTTRSKSISGRSAMRMRFRIDGNATFKATQGEAPARVRLYMQRRGDNWQWDHISYRFWSGPLDLSIGEYTLEGKLVPGQWINVGGKHDEAGFQPALAEVENIGFTFGGTFAGHGVYAEGDARFYLLEFAVL